MEAELSAEGKKEARRLPLVSCTSASRVSSLPRPEPPDIKQISSRRQDYHHRYLRYHIISCMKSHCLLFPSLLFLSQRCLSPLYLPSNLSLSRVAFPNTVSSLAGLNPGVLISHHRIGEADERVIARKITLNRSYSTALFTQVPWHTITMSEQEHGSRILQKDGLPQRWNPKTFKGIKSS